MTKAEPLKQGPPLAVPPPSGQAEWVTQALDRYESPLIRYAWRLTGDLDRARDAVQDTFLKLCSADPATLDGHLGAWLYTVCRNTITDVARKESRMSALNEVALAAWPSDEPTPAAALERTETAGRLTGLLDGLPPLQQEVLRLKFQEGLGYRDIAGIIGQSPSYVGVLIHKAVTTLRGHYAAGATATTAGKPAGPSTKVTPLRAAKRA